MRERRDPWVQTPKASTKLFTPIQMLVAQMVKNPPAMQETQVQSPGQEDPLEEVTDRGAWRGYSPWGCKESDVTEQLTLSRYSNVLILQREKPGAR